jgi:hypothetical protein
MKHRLLRFGPGILAVIVSVLLLTSWGQDQKRAGPASSETRTPSSAATARAADGHPDLSGLWNGAGGGINRTSEENGNITSNVNSRRCAPNQRGCGDQTNQTVDGEFTGRMDPNRPLYKPEFWDKVQDLDRNTNTMDPLFKCQPYGVPRMGPPTKIVQTANEVIFLYAAAGAGTQPNDFRIIPIDGREHDPVRSQDVSFYGDSVGHWEGNTLVVDSVGFNDLTWLDKGGYFHTDNMHVIEKLWREGDTLHYQATVDDPGVLLQPWTMSPRVLRLNTNPKAYIREGDPCRDVDFENMVSKIRH